MLTNSTAYGKLPTLLEPLNCSAHRSIFSSVHSQNKGRLKEQMIVTCIVPLERHFSSFQLSPGHLCIGVSSASLLLLPLALLKCKPAKVLSVKGWSESPEVCNLIQNHLRRLFTEIKTYHQSLANRQIIWDEQPVQISASFLRMCNVTIKCNAL